MEADKGTARQTVLREALSLANNTCGAVPLSILAAKKSVGGMGDTTGRKDGAQQAAPDTRLGGSVIAFLDKRRLAFKGP